MKVRVAFSQIIQPKLIQYMIDNHGSSYDTIETVKNTWRRTFPVSEEILEDIFVQIKTIEKVELEEREYKRETYQTSLTQIIADYLCKYIRRCFTYKYFSKAEIEAFVKQKIDISENKLKNAQFEIKRVTSKFIYIADVSKSEVNITCQVQDVLWHLYKYHKLEDRRLFFRDTLGKISEIVHDNGTFLNFADNHMYEIEKPPAIRPTGSRS